MTEGVNLGNNSVQDKNELQGFDAQLSVNKSQGKVGLTNSLTKTAANADPKLAKDDPSMEGG